MLSVISWKLVERVIYNHKKPVSPWNSLFLVDSCRSSPLFLAMGKARWILLGQGTHWHTGFDHTELNSFLMTGLSFSQHKSQVPGEESPPAPVMLFPWCFCSSLCSRIVLVPTCISSGGFFTTSSLKLLHWDSRTHARTKCTSPLLPCKERLKGFSKHYFPFSHPNCKTCRQVPGGASNSEL